MYFVNFAAKHDYSKPNAEVLVVVDNYLAHYLLRLSL
jgi:hypothetical protein